MGVFHLDFEVSLSPKESQRATVRQALVDTGSELTWVPDEIRIGVEVWKKDQGFVMANDQTVTRDIGIALIHCGEFKTVDEVVFAKPGDCSLLGARTIEGFNARVDSLGRRLLAAGPMLAAGNRRCAEKY